MNPKDDHTSAIEATSLVDLGLSAKAIRHQLSRILSSEYFVGSPRMIRFLQFAVEQALSGGGAGAKEALVGIAVFDRDTMYDPRTDPIVRVEARRLRMKLQMYYEGVGHSDTILVELPKGGYAAQFKMRPGLQADLGTMATVVLLPFETIGPGICPHLPDALSEELTFGLLRILSLSVVASVAQTCDRHQKLCIARENATASYALCGSLRTAGDSIRITAHLVEIASGRYIWSEAFDRPRETVCSSQEEIACTIVASLGSGYLATTLPSLYSSAVAGEFQSSNCGDVLGVRFTSCPTHRGAGCSFLRRGGSESRRRTFTILRSVATELTDGSEHSRRDCIPGQPNLKDRIYA